MQFNQRLNEVNTTEHTSLKPSPHTSWSSPPCGLMT